MRKQNKFKVKIRKPVGFFTADVYVNGMYIFYINVYMNTGMKAAMHEHICVYVGS